MKTSLISIAVLLILPTAASATAELEEPPQSNEPAVSQPQESAPTAVIQTPASTSSASPPGLSNRPPLAPPPAVSLPNRKGKAPVPSLAWRAKAYRLAQDFPNSRSSDCKAWKVCAAPLDDTMKALSSACTSSGLKIEATSDDAGQIAARSTDPSLSKVQVIFAVKALAADQTAVLVGVFPETKAIKPQMLDDLLERTDLMVSKKGLL